MAESLSKNTSGIKNTRESLNVPLEERYKKSNIKETKTPTAVNGIPDKFARGFVMEKGKNLLSSDFTGEESFFVKGIDTKKYNG